MRRTRRWVPAVYTLTLFASASALADRQFDPYAGVVVENNSNLFDVAPQYAVASPDGVPRLSDTVTTYRAGFDFDYLFDRQRFYATLEGRELEYDRFTDLNHSEYLANLGLAWNLTSRFDGIVDARREKKIISFAENDLTEKQIQTDQVVKGTFNIAVTPEWRVETQASLHTLDFPIALSPDFRLQEGSEGVGVKYVGIANLSYGIEGSHLEGRYDGVSNASDYEQNTAQFAAKYSLSGITKVNAAIGYTDRTIQNSPTSVSGVTGQFGYDRQLTGKTAISLLFQRAVNSYYTAGSSEIDTGGTATISWQSSPKLGVLLRYQRTDSTFEGETLLDYLTAGRKDVASYSSIELAYKPLHWLTIRPYAKRQVRESNFQQFEYNDTQIGIEIVAQRDQITR